MDWMFGRSVGLSVIISLKGMEFTPMLLSEHLFIHCDLDNFVLANTEKMGSLWAIKVKAPTGL